MYDDKDVTKSSVNVTIKTASVNTDNTNRDNDLRSANYFDVEKFPEITFQSKSVEKKGNDYVAHGTLTIHGVAKDVDMPFEMKGPVDGGQRQSDGRAWQRHHQPAGLWSRQSVTHDRRRR